MIRTIEQHAKHLFADQNTQEPHPPYRELLFFSSNFKVCYSILARNAAFTPSKSEILRDGKCYKQVTSCAGHWLPEHLYNPE